MDGIYRNEWSRLEAWSRREMHGLLAFALVDGGSRRIQFSLSPIRSLGEVKGGVVFACNSGRQSKLQGDLL